MINKELKRLNRRELVDIIYQLKKNEEEMQQEIESLKKGLEDKRLAISTAGSIADAAMTVTNVFNVAQSTADIYLREISLLKEDTEKECAKMIEDANAKVNEIFENGQKKFSALKTAYKNEYAKWQQLKTQISELKEKKELELCEDVENG